jgi:uncharacterized membrane protein
MSRLRRDSRGAAAIFMALTMCFVILPVTAFVVDIGMQRVARRDAQSIADAAAQDAARALGTGTTSQTVLEAIARDTATKTVQFVGTGSPSVQLFLGKIEQPFVSDQSLGCGSSHFNSYFTSPQAGVAPDAVLVVVRNSVSFNFVGGDGGVCRSAIARSYKSACMIMDSYAAALRSNDGSVLGPLTRMLGTSLDTTVLSGSGILTTDLDLLRFLNVLKTQLNLGTIDQVLAANVTALQVLQAQATALTQQGAASTAVSALNSQIVAHLGPLASQPINIGTLVGITQGGSSALGATINAFDLAAAAVQLANGTNPVAATVALPAGLVGSTSVSATIGSRPTRVCLGEGTKKMAQTAVTADATLSTADSVVLNAVNGLVTGLQNVVGGVLCVVYCEQNVVSVTGVSVKATASLAQASGRVNSLSCTGATPNSMAIQEDADLAPLKVSVTLNLKNVHSKKTLLGVPLEPQTTTNTTFTLNLTTADPPDPTRSATLLVPDDYDVGKPGPSGNVSVGSLSVESQTQGADAGNIVAGLLGGVSVLVTNTMNLLVTPLLSKVLSPLLSALTTTLQNTVGLTIAGSTYTPLRTPACGTPALVG